MSDSDDSGVMVEHNDAPPELAEEEEKPKDSSDTDTTEACQILAVGGPEDDYAFQFNKIKYDSILSKVPPGWKVAVVSVVGAFRTGKSFLLSWFLRYLSALEKAVKDGKSLEDYEIPWYKQFDSVGKDGFHWKAGTERNTTGIWLWTRPFFLKTANGEDMAVLLVDTQGMFDHETSMQLTASIFGMSTLLSSYQIYNVSKRIQEDNLQQLALFSEFARTAMDEADFQKKPFQQIEFLVRDWEHFDEEDEEKENYSKMEKEMEVYLADVLKMREADDLKETRAQILKCFEKIDCYVLPHPGLPVTKKTYEGDVAKVQEIFLKMLDRYCQRVFSVENLQPKQIHDHELTAVELGSYVASYAELFASGAKFPEASTLLEATASANNSNATNLSLSKYRDFMDHVCGPKCSNYVKPEELEEEHTRARTKALKEFRSIATFGSRASVSKAEEKVVETIDRQWELYQTLNSQRDPLMGLGMFVAPVFGSLVFFFLQKIFSWCSYDICHAAYSTFAHTHAAMLCFVCILVAQKFQLVKEMLEKLYSGVMLVMDNSNATKKKMD